MKLIAKTHGGKLRDCVFDCSLIIGPGEVQDIVAQVEKGRLNFQCSISEILEEYE